MVVRKNQVQQWFCTNIYKPEQECKLSFFSQSIPCHSQNRIHIIAPQKKLMCVCLCFFHSIFRVHFDFGLVSFLEPHQWNWINTKNQFTFQTDEMRWFRSLCKMPFGPFAISNRATTFKVFGKVQIEGHMQRHSKTVKSFFQTCLALSADTIFVLLGISVVALVI